MAVLNILKKIKVETMKFENHPCNEMDLETKMHYLNGLLLVTNEDDVIDDKEIEYINILINSFGLNSENLDEAIEFAKNPDEDIILNMIEVLKSKDIKYSFILDCMVLANADGNYDENETALIEQYGDMLEITNQKILDIKHIFEKLKAKDAQGIDSLCNTSIIDKKLIEYLLDFYKIDMNYGLSDEEREILSFDFFTPVFQYGGLNNATEIMQNPVSKEQYCIFLNIMFRKNQIKLDENKNIIDSENDLLLLSREQGKSKINFYNNVFILDEFNKENQVVNITYHGIIKFVEWINNTLSKEYKVCEFFADGSNDVTVKISNEEISTSMCSEIYKYNNEFFRFDHSCGSSYVKIGQNKLSNIDCSPKSSFRLMK